MPKLSAQKPETTYRNAAPKAKQYTITDGGGLTMLVMPDRSKRWIYRYRIHGERRNLTLSGGGYPSVSVKAARTEAERLRGLLSRGEDPSETRKAKHSEKKQQNIEALKEQVRTENTFKRVALDWLRETSKERTPDYSKAILQRLEKNIFPRIGQKPISELKPTDVLGPLRLVKERGAVESAHRIKGICSQIFRFALFSGIIDSDPTRDLKGALGKHQSRHLAAITDPAEVPGLLHSIHAYKGSTEVKTAMLLGILTFVRPGNLRHADWSEFHNLEKPEIAEWRIPSEKMKVSTGRDFIVPLAPQAIALINKIRPVTGLGQYLFPSPRSDKRPMSANGVLSALRRMGYTSEEMTGHGVRAMARTICAEVLEFPPEVIEEQLAHQKQGALRDAYDRTQYLKQRRKLMKEWANFLDQLAPGVFPHLTDHAIANDSPSASTPASFGNQKRV